MFRTGHTPHYLKSSSDDWFGIGVDGGSNNGLKLKLYDTGLVELSGNLQTVPGNGLVLRKDVYGSALGRRINS